MTIEYLVGLIRALLVYAGVWDLIVTAIMLIVIISTVRIVLDKLR